ncbi:MAG: extradiol ring-cleavage dioxygenase, partial [Acidimicrobiales bacterium]
MAEIMGIGLSHYPLFGGRDEDMASILRWTLEDPAIPESDKDPRNWPELMRREWGDDAGIEGAAAHRSALIDGFSKVRQAIDEFGPDALVIWGDDQYENFKEDVIPAFTVQIYDDLELYPWRQAQASSALVGKPNIWDEGAETKLVVRGAPDVGRCLAEGLISRDVDVAYAYRPLHHEGLPHAFLNTVLYLDYERKGFSYPIVPFPINCYGRRVISYKGFLSRLSDARRPDPPSPSPSRVMDVGARGFEVLAESRYRIALVASSSWSHAFLCDKTWRLRPDTDRDRQFYQALEGGD